MHDKEHVSRVRNVAADLIDKAGDIQLSVLELSLLLVAVYLHDIGNILGRGGHERAIGRTMNAIGANVGIDADKCHFIPEGVPGLFRTIYAPADYIETVNTMGQRMYAKQWTMPNGKGVNLEFQTNTLHLCSRPRLLMQARRT